MADEKVRYVLDVDDKGTPKLVKFGDSAKAAGKKAEAGFSKAGKAVSDFGDQIPGVSSAMQSMAAGPAVMAGAAVAALGVGFASMIKKQIDFADGMNDLSLRLGISTERLSVLSLYAEQSGTDIESLASAMGKLGVKISEGDKNLARWGITAGTADEALFQLADRIAGTEDPMLRLKIATDAFGKSGQQMLPLLVQGGDALRQMADSAPVVSSEMAAMADRVNDRFAELGGRIQGIALGIADKIMPQIDAWLDGVDRIRRAMGLLSKEEEYQEKRTEARAKIIATYAEQIERRKAGEKLIGPVKGAITVDGMTLQQALAAFDRNNPANRPTAAPASGAAGKFGAGAGISGKAEKIDPAFAAIQDQLYQERIALAATLQKRRGATSSLSAGGMPSLAAGMQGTAGVGIGATSIYAQQMSEEDRIKALAEYQKFLDETVTMSEASAARVESSMVNIAQSASSVLAESFLQISDGVDAFGESIVNGFASMLSRMAAELAANAALVGFLSLINPGAAASFAGGLGGLSGLVLGRATGGPVNGGAVMFNERREEAIIQRGPARVEPVASGGDTFIFQVQNPAQAASLQRELQSERRLGKRGIRR